MKCIYSVLKAQYFGYETAAFFKFIFKLASISMEKDQKELTDRIRSAIKEKLVEINAFVDDELPDYIMILVANKRGKSQIEKDLSLFLGNDTVVFTNWLWDLVKNIKTTFNEKSSLNIAKKDETCEKKNPESDEDVDVLDYDLDEQERAIFDQEDDSKNFPQVPTTSKTCRTSKVNEALPIAEAKSAFNEKPQKKQPQPSEQCKVNPKPEGVHSAQNIPRMPLLSTVVPIEQVVNRNVEYDPTKPDFSGNVSSVVRVSQRKFGGPAALQANKLLLRAVNDATKSILDGHSISNFYKPTPIKVLSSNRKDDQIRSRNLINVKIVPNIDFNTKSENPLYLDEISNDSNINDEEIESYVVSDASQNNRTICLASESTNLGVFDDVSRSPFDTNLDNYSELDEQRNSPHFIVTLDGVDLPSFKRKYTDIKDEDMEIDEERILSEEQDDEIIGSAPEKKPKVTERCKYWPACKNSDNCFYHHPTVPCKCFPDCKYGDKCLYIHPNCKFDSFCSRKDCPYTHVSKRKFSVTPVVFKARSNKSVCKFYPKCTVNKCPYIHPKLCRYGAKCRLRVCPYSHFNIPPRNQMKWKATV